MPTFWIAALLFSFASGLLQRDADSEDTIQSIIGRMPACAPPCLYDAVVNIPTCTDWECFCTDESKQHSQYAQPCFENTCERARIPDIESSLASICAAYNSSSTITESRDLKYIFPSCVGGAWRGALTGAGDVSCGSTDYDCQCLHYEAIWAQAQPRIKELCEESVISSTYAYLGVTCARALDSKERFLNAFAPGGKAAAATVEGNKGTNVTGASSVVAPSTPTGDQAGSTQTSSSNVAVKGETEVAGQPAPGSQDKSNELDKGAIVGIGLAALGGIISAAGVWYARKTYMAKKFKKGGLPERIASLSVSRGRRRRRSSLS